MRHTQSQDMSYYDRGGLEVARVQQFVYPDGKLAASGRPDPKRVLYKGKLYRIAKAHAATDNALFKNIDRFLTLVSKKVAPWLCAVRLRWGF